MAYSVSVVGEPKAAFEVAEPPSQRQLRRSSVFGGGPSARTSEPLPAIAAGPVHVVAGISLPTQVPVTQESTGVQRRASSQAVPSGRMLPAQTPALQTSPAVHELPSSQVAPSFVGTVQSTPMVVAVT